MPPDLAAELLGAVNAMRTEMDRRLGGIAVSVDRLDAKLDGVCDQVEAIEQSRQVEAALARQRNETALSHTLDWRWRIGIAVAAAGGLGGFVLAIVNLIGGH